MLPVKWEIYKASQPASQPASVQKRESVGVALVLEPHSSLASPPPTPREDGEEEEATAKLLLTQTPSQAVTVSQPLYAHRVRGQSNPTVKIRGLVG